MRCTGRWRTYDVFAVTAKRCTENLLANAGNGMALPPSQLGDGFVCCVRATLLYIIKQRVVTSSPSCAHCTKHSNTMLFDAAAPGPRAFAGTRWRPWRWPTTPESMQTTQDLWQTKPELRREQTRHISSSRRGTDVIFNEPDIPCWHIYAGFNVFIMRI